VQLKPLGSFRPGRESDRLAELHGLTSTASGRRVGLPGLLSAVRASDVQFFQGTGKNQGKTPDAISVGRTIKGAFQHKPGTLRDSIRFVGVRREDNRLVATVRAHAPYAWYVHEGFTRENGKMVAGRPFLKNALINVRSRLGDIQG
jgi:hypothetical protein